MKPITLIDTHAHLNFNAFRDDLDEVIKRTLAENIWVINVGSKYETSKKAVEIAERYGNGVFSAIGLHPMHSAAGLVKIRTDPEEGNFTTEGEGFDKEKYKELAKSEKVVAIGEIGLDYYYKPKTKRKLGLFKERQKEALLSQLGLAREIELPVIFHCRMAHQDLLEILKSKVKTQKSKIQGVIHCFTGTWEQAREYLEMGFYLGFNGIVFKLDLDEVIKKTPLEKILIETDCPYLTPPQVDVERNEPIFVNYIVGKITKIRGIDYQKIAEITASNAKELFKI